jgi:nucleoside-diphosphate-sugar epimerase
MCKGSLLPCFENNVLNFIKLIEKLNDDQVLIYSSTAAVYGNNKNLVDESYPIAGGISYYDYTKICNENIISLYPNKKILGLRFGSIGGFSKNFRGENLLNSISMSSLKSNEITITNPENYRSVLGMSDLCRVFSTILAEDTIKNRIYNITSINAKIIEFAQDIQRLTNCKLIVSDKFPTNYSFNCDNSLFQNDYGFKFQDNVASIYDDIITNRDFIISNVLRESV